MTREEHIRNLKYAMVICKDILDYLEKEPKYCDRNICLKNEYNGIGCDECEVTKSQEPKTDYIAHGTDGNFYKLTISNGKEFEQEPCGDAISRQAMHIELEKWITYGEYKYSNATKYLYDRIDRLPPVKQEPRWIPVSERLPEEKQAVLVWCPQYKNIYCAYLEKEQWWIFGAFVQIVPNEVIAWMPLPTPYDSQERSDKE